MCVMIPEHTTIPCENDEGRGGGEGEVKRDKKESSTVQKWWGSGSLDLDDWSNNDSNSRRSTQRTVIRLLSPSHF